MYYIFRKTVLWDAMRNIDKSHGPMTVRAKTEPKARKKLPFEMGREWILVGTKKQKK